jgi:hypothetical protein
MKMTVTILLGLTNYLFLFGQDSIKKYDNCKSIFNIAQLNKCSLIELGREFKRLRKLDSDDCFKFESDLHTVMIKIGDSIGKSGFSKVEIENYMGVPDSTDKTYMTKLLNLKHDQDVMVYCWRGWHDFLYFVMVKDIVKRSGWWFAYE